MTRTTTLALAAAMAIAVRPVTAETLRQNLNLQALGKSMWGTGSSSSIDKEYFYGSSWDSSSTSGSFSNTCVTVPIEGKVCSGKTGVQITGSSEGTAGLMFRIFQDSGSVDATIPMDSTLTVLGTPRAGHHFHVDTDVDLNPGATLKTVFPNAEMTGHLILDAHAKMKVETCAFGDCDTASTGDILRINDQDLSLFSYNHNGDNKLKLFGVPVPVFQFNHAVNIPLVGPKFGDMRINNVNLALTGKSGTLDVCQASVLGHCIFGSDTLTGLKAVGSVKDMLDIRMDILNTALYQFGLSFSSGVPVPGCEIPLCSVSIDIGDLNIGPVFGISQTLFLQESINRDAKVTFLVKETGEEKTVTEGDEVSLFFPSDQTGLHITPTYSVTTTFYNRTYLTMGPDLNFNFLKMCVAGECVGPLYQFCPTMEEDSDCEVPLDSVLAFIPLVDKHFSMTLTATGDEFIVGTPQEDPGDGDGGVDTVRDLDPPNDPGGPGGGSEVPEPSDWILAALGLGMIGSKRFFGQRRGQKAQ